MRPIVLYEIYRGARRVVACSAQARALGITPGMSLSEATALAEAAAISLCPEPADPVADRQALEKLAQTCQQFSPVVGLEESDAPESLLLDITGLAHLFHGEQRLAEEVFRSLLRRRLVARIGVADTVGAAWAVAHFGEKGREGVMLKHNLRDWGIPIRVLPPQQSFPALGPMPIEALRLPIETIALLHQLGVSQVGQLASLPRSEFDIRFGPELLRRWDQAWGQMAEPIVAQPFPSELQAEQSLEQPTGRRETIEFLLQQLIGRVAEMLFRCGRGATQFECRLECGKTNIELSLGLFQPNDSPQHLWQLVQMRLERLSLPAPVSAIAVRAVTTAILHRRQQELFCGDCSTPALDGTLTLERDESYSSRGRLDHTRLLAALVDRLSSRLGHRAVLRPRLVRDAQPELAYHCDPLVEGGRGRRRGTAGSIGFKGNRRDRRTRLSKPAAAPGGAMKGVMLKHNLPGDRPQQLPMRPLKLVGRPVSLVAISILPEGPPVQFHWQGREHTIAGRWGPERIQTGWWRGQVVGRDYYRIETTDGRRFWLFRRLRDGRWFLHGMFE